MPSFWRKAKSWRPKKKPGKSKVYTVYTSPKRSEKMSVTAYSKSQAINKYVNRRGLTSKRGVKAMIQRRNCGR